jgi:anti-sigma regulatory factor (Ser/Thr protein kinase)
VACAGDAPLGVFETPGHQEVEIELDRGSTLVLYTDGLVEERGVSIDVGLEALRRAAEHPGDPEELCDRLLAAMRELHVPADDVAVLALRALPAAPEPLHLELLSDPDMLASVRRDLARWLRAVGAVKQEVEVVQLAANEACANAIEHGAAGSDATFSLHAELDGELLSLTVGDSGRWVERPDGPLPDRGHGLPLMRALVDHVEVTRGSEGTQVLLAHRLACHPSEECSSTRSNGSATRASASEPASPSST